MAEAVQPARLGRYLNVPSTALEKYVGKFIFQRETEAKTEIDLRQHENKKRCTGLVMSSTQKEDLRILRQSIEHLRIRT